ncbi:uncharacterized protein isoform X1 [Rhodnius prolixus]|uniref:uncharacterized protein isoform X1 n=1 Tax=Rhodnius prolixus TaxID=13249 RepID=UPI003D18E2BE
MCLGTRIHLIISLCYAWSAGAKIGGWDTAPNTQYHIQTDEGPERYFKYQTISGQYRKEKRLQDGTVVGSYGWVDANGFLRLRDYIADDKGYRIVNTKMVRVGVDMPIGEAVSVSKKLPSQGGVGLQQTTRRPPTKPAPISLSDYLNEKFVTSPAPISLSDYLKEKQYATTPAPLALSTYLKSPIVEVSNNGLPSSTAAPFRQEPNTTPAPIEYPSTPAPYYSTTPSHVRPQTFRPYFNPNAITYDQKAYESVGAARYETGQGEPPQYDGVAMTHNGFRYYLPRHYHEEETLQGDQRAGSFGYIDPFGIRRVIYYNTSPVDGFVHRKNNRYVGFQATPYDPRF